MDTKTCSTTTVFHRQKIHDQQSSIPEISKAFVLCNDEETINRVIPLKQLNPSQDHPTLGFRVSKSFSRNHDFRVL
jgi:hypothetical protein